MAPLAAGIVALATLPPLVALYFLRLRRTRRVVSSTMLWVRATEDLHANTPFQRIRFSLLLLLQIIALALVALAIAQPHADLGEATAKRVVMLMDRSGSMGATDAEGGSTRLDEAKRLARARVEQLHEGGLFSAKAPTIMVIAFASDAEIVCPFTDNAARLRAAIDAIEPTDETTRIADAFELARAFTTVTNPDNAAATPAEPPAYELYSDGLVADASSCALRPGESVVYRRVGEIGAGNAGLAALAVARTPDRPDEVEVYARVINWSPQPWASDLELRVDGTIRAVTPEPVEVPPRSSDPATGRLSPGQSQVIFPSLALPRGGVVTVRAVKGDLLAADDRASVVAAPQVALRVALVGRGAFVIRSILDAMGLAELDAMSVEAWDDLVAKDPYTPDQYDAIVLDAVAPAVTLRGHYLAFAVPPRIEGLVPFGTKSNAVVRSVREGHPLLQFVNLDDLFVASMTAVAAGGDAEVIVEAGEGPLVLTLRRGPLAVVCVTFDPMESNWPFQRGFVNFFVNALRWVAAGGDAVSEEPLVPGQVARARIPIGARAVVVSTPGGSATALEVHDASDISFGPLRMSGVYELSWDGPANPSGTNSESVAVNMDSAGEGLIDAAETLGFAAQRVAGIVGGATSRSALWPWFLLAALAVLMLEWWVWLRRV